MEESSKGKGKPKPRSKSKSNPHLVVKSNELINARMNGFTVAQIRLFEMLIAQLEREQDDFHPQRIYLTDFVAGIGTKHKGEFDRAREITKSLMQHVIEIWDGDQLKQRNILHKADYDKKKPYVEIVFHPDLRPYLLQLKEKFTTYDVRNILSLKKVHSIRLYQILKQHLYTGTRTFEVEELKYILGVENKYKKYNDFKKYAVMAAQRELQEKCDITFEFEEIKKGRKVEMLRFTIKRQQGQFAVSDSDLASAEGEELIRALMDMGLTEAKARHYVQSRQTSDIKEAIIYTQRRYNQGKIKSSPTAYLIKLLDAEVQIRSNFEKQQDEKQRKIMEARRRREIKRLEEVRLVESLEKEFGQMRKAQIDQLVNKASEDDWESFRSWAGSNMFVSAKVFPQGSLNKNSEETQSYFRMYLADRLPERKRAFITWAAERGYHLHEENGQFWMKDQDWDE